MKTNFYNLEFEFRHLFGVVYRDVVFYDFAENDFFFGDGWRQTPSIIKYKNKLILTGDEQKVLGGEINIQLQRLNQLARVDEKSELEKNKLEQMVKSARQWENVQVIARVILPTTIWLADSFNRRILFCNPEHIQHPEFLKGFVRKGHCGLCAYVVRNNDTGKLKTIDWRAIRCYRRAKTVLQTMLEELSYKYYLR